MTTVALARPVRFTGTTSHTISKRQQHGVEQHLNDEELITAISLGDEHALELLYQRYSRFAYAAAYRILHEGTSAEDIVQEAFLSVWHKAASYQKHQGSVYSWLLAIVHHRAIDRIRSAAFRDQQSDSLQAEDMQEPVSPQREVWEEAWLQEQGRLIRETLRQLPGEQREVIELAYFAGYTHAEIAEHKHIAPGTVKGRMRLGLQKMKHLLDTYGLDSLG